MGAGLRRHDAEDMQARSIASPCGPRNSSPLVGTFGTRAPATREHIELGIVEPGGDIQQAEHGVEQVVVAHGLCRLCRLTQAVSTPKSAWNFGDSHITIGMCFCTSGANAYGRPCR